MNKDMKRSVLAMLLFGIALFFLPPLWLKLFCAFCVGVNFEALMFAWRIKNGEKPM